MKKLKVRVANLLKATQLVDFQLRIRGFCPRSALSASCAEAAQPPQREKHPSKCGLPPSPLRRALLCLTPRFIARICLYNKKSWPAKLPSLPLASTWFLFDHKNEHCRKTGKCRKNKEAGKNPHMTYYSEATWLNALVSLLPIFSITKQGWYHNCI